MIFLFRLLYRGKIYRCIHNIHVEIFARFFQDCISFVGCHYLLSFYPCIAPGGAELARWPPGVVIGEKVDLLGALMKLTRPVVTEQQKKINQLKQTIESLETQAREAKQQIEKLEKEMK